VGLAATGLIVAAVALGLVTTLWQTRIALEALPASGRPASALTPEIVQFTVLLWIGLGAAVYFTRASARRIAGALAAGLAFMLLFVAEEAIPASTGLRHFSWTVTPPSGLVYTAIIPYGAAIALLGWRITRRFAWRGQLALLLAASIGGPLRDHLWTLWLPGVAAVPGLVRWITDGVMWLGGIGLGQAIMRLISGPAKSDSLTPLRRKL
jgi:hypothetical protein